MNRLLVTTLPIFMLCAFWNHAVLGETKPLKVFILAGQSNMQGHAQVRTFGPIGMDPKTAPLLKAMQDDDGNPIVCENVYISSLGSAEAERVGKLTAGFGASNSGPKIGPEFTFGIYMQQLLDEPILIIKTAWGGKSLNTDFRPPSAGAYQFSDEQLQRFKERGQDVEKIRKEKEEATGHYYRLMMEHVRKVLADIPRVYPDYNPEQGYELAGFVWFQGWNDMVDSNTYPNRGQAGGYDLYSRLMATFIRDVRNDLKAPDLPFVIGVMGVGGPVEKYSKDQQRYKGIHQNFRLAMAAPTKLPEFKDNSAAVFTENYWDMEVDELRRRERALKKLRDDIRKQLKSGEVTREQAAAAEKKLYEENFTERELILLRESTSNADFHYMGSAKIMALIGKAFAEATYQLHQQSAKK